VLVAGHPSCPRSCRETRDYACFCSTGRRYFFARHSVPGYYNML